MSLIPRSKQNRFGIDANSSSRVKGAGKLPTANGIVFNPYNFAIISVFFSFYLHPNVDQKYMGSLLSDPPVAIPYGHFVLRNFLFYDNHQGVYQSNWSRSSRIDSYNSIQYELQ